MNIILILTLAAIILIIAWAIMGEKTTPSKDQSASEKGQNDGQNRVFKRREADRRLEEPDKIFRRREADRKIENEYPAEETSLTPADENVYGKKSPEGQIEVPFPANEIIADRSRFKLYKRTLINSEIYAKRGDIDTAVSLYSGVKDRILDNGIRDKIESNIFYLNSLRQKKEDDLKKKIESLYTNPIPQMQQELKLKIEGIIPPTITVNFPEKDLINTDEIVGKISEQINDKLSNLTEAVEEQDDLSQENKEILKDIQDMKVQIDNLSDIKRTIEELQEVREDDLSQENNVFLKDIQDMKVQIDNLSNIKYAMDELQEKINDIKALPIPETTKEPAIIQAKYDSPIPVHFDPQPVLDLLEKLDQRRRDNKLLDKIPYDDLSDKYPVDKNVVDKILSDKILSDKILPDKQAKPEEKKEHTPDEILKSEKEVERHHDADEDPNAFDLLKDIDKPKDDSTITDEEIFKKILQNDEKEKSASDFEIVGDTVPEESEFTSDDPAAAHRSKSDHDFYKKFISTDRIKKRELPILKVSYDFKKLPDEFSLSREKNILEYAFYKYKPMLQRADEFMKSRHVKDAINYYKVVLDQNIPIEFKAMIRKNIKDLAEYLEKYLASD